VGAGGRAAAGSARRAGFEPTVIDLFADADTRRLATTILCPPDEYPHGLVRLAERAPPGPWLYAGGLENHPDVVAAISERRPLLGNGPDVLRRVRDPFALPNLFTGGGFRFPRTLRPTDPLPADGRWLRKPLRGAGGLGVRFATPGDIGRDGGHVLQEFIDGEPYSVMFQGESRAVWDARPEPHRPRPRNWPFTVRLACFRQLVGTRWLHAPPFAYAGNVGPLDVPFGHPLYIPACWAEHRADLLRLGLSGLWGIDLILRDGAAYLLEVNPRYTASVELVEWCRPMAPLATHADCFARPGCNVMRKTWQRWPAKVGKAIYYAPARLTFPAAGPWDESLARCTDVNRRPDYADIPDPGVIEAGHPVLTILAEAATEADCLAELKRRAAALDRLLGFPTPAEDAPC
jgi:predicted ATP-grasp superfamily ATP-dependent carboligase